MQYGFLLDQTKCIGCHACTVACKAENDVPIGSFRTWVKYTENGRFPAIKRHFTVLRCNHCTQAPCVTICPVNALEKRADGIVDIDRDACIGCRACMQGCPYDAIYLNEDSGAVEKCHFCAHRIERNLEPACVIVCPVEAIVVGDLHDPESRLAQLANAGSTTVRRPEQNTGPNVHYIGALDASLHPGRAERPATYLWSEVPPTKPDPWPKELATAPDVRTVLDAGHRVQWGMPVALYLITKGIAAGAAILAPWAAQLGLRGFAANYLPEILAIVFTTLTTVLLVEDLHRPAKFLTLLTRPNWRSWLVKGAWILIAFSATTTLTLVLRPFAATAPVADGLRWVSAFLGLGVAGYTAFLFAQCEGRDLWQGKALLPHLLFQAVACGATVLLPFATGDGVQRLTLIAALAIVWHLAFALLERHGQHGTDNARQAAAFLGHVRLGSLPAFQVATALAVAALLALWPLPLAAFAIFLPALFLYEWAYIRAGQLPPLS